MCGIAGFIDPKLSKDEAEKKIQLVMESIAYRGPDARGIWIDMPVVLGHNRLSIIDLSSDGNQPMHFFDCAIIFNGEIYNYIEVRETLKTKGYQFKTQSDTEVILAAYREYGDKCVEHFMGMWAMAIWDKKEEILFCSRDRFGIKPFYYIHEGDRFYFGSEYKALKHSPLFMNTLNYDSVSRGLQLGWMCYDDETYFSKIKSLPAASNLVFSKGRVILKHYWEINLYKKDSGTFEEKKEKFYQLFDESIRQHMRSDVEVGGCLSGGLDSSSIASVIARDFPQTKFKTFTVYYEGKDEVDERPFVYEVLKKYPSLLPYYFSPSENEIAESFDNVLHHAEVPISTSSAISQYFVMKLAAQQKIKVLVDGQGSDEMLGGYMHSFYRLIGGLFSKLRFGEAMNQLNGHKQMQHLGSKKSFDVLLKSLLTGMLHEQSLYSMEYKNYFPFLSNDNHANFSLHNNSGTRLNNFLFHLMQTTSLPTLLHFEDRNSMAFSIESRVPFLDHHLVEFVFSLDDFDKIHNGETKLILRKSLAKILPDAITNRKDKKGFVTPGEIKWLRGPLKFLIDTDFTSLDFLNKQKVNSLITSFKKGDNSNATFVWRIAVLNYWLKKI